MKDIGDGNTFMVAVTTDQTTSIFYAKSNGNSGKASASKNKVVKKESQIKITNQNE